MADQVNSSLMATHNSLPGLSYGSTVQLKPVPKSEYHLHGYELPLPTTSGPSVSTSMKSLASPLQLGRGDAETKQYVIKANCWGITLARHFEAQLGFITLKLEGAMEHSGHPEMDDTPHPTSNCDVTEFNFWAIDDKSINLHLSFRRGDGKLHIAQWFSGKWHEWGAIRFHDLFGCGDGIPVDEEIRISWNEKAQIYNLDTGRDIWHLDMQPLAATYYVNYKTHPNRIWKASLDMDYKYEI
ncbi:hypothetical protein V499_02281 [Pseudogymnoascus sp. VKM F-103]|nr:hypothetical protein V499_02281 [Pseudogymnoascus sp. VKM F-103]